MHNNKHSSSGSKGQKDDGEEMRGRPWSEGDDISRASTSSRVSLVDDVQPTPRSARLTGNDDADRPDHPAAMVEPAASKSSSGVSVVSGNEGRAFFDHNHRSEPSPSPPSAAPNESAADIRTPTGSIGVDDDPDVFEVAFDPTGPLGITFEWAVDPTVWSGAATESRRGIPQRSNGEDEAKNVAVGTAPWQRQQTTTACVERGKTSAHLQRTERENVAEDGPYSAGPPAVQQVRRSEFGTTASPAGEGSCDDSPRPLLPLSTLPPISLSSIALDTESLPHALRIQSFPALPSEAKTTDTDKPADQSSIDVTKHLTNTAERPVMVGPAAGRGVLRPGDILIEVNGKPVAGPAARQAGIASFQDAVQVVASAAAGCSSSEKRQTERRIFTFRRAQQRPSSSRSLPAPTPTSPLPPAILPLSGGWVRGMSGSAAGARVETPEEMERPLGVVGDGADAIKIATPVLSTKSSSLLRPIVHLKGLGRSLGSTKEKKGGLFTLVSSRSNSSIGSDMTDRSSTGGGVGIKRGKGGRRKVGGGGNSANGPPGGSAAERIKAEAR